MLIECEIWGRGQLGTEQRPGLVLDTFGDTVAATDTEQNVSSK